MIAIALETTITMLFIAAYRLLLFLSLSVTLSHTQEKYTGAWFGLAIFASVSLSAHMSAFVPKVRVISIPPIAERLDGEQVKLGDDFSAIPPNLLESSPPATLRGSLIH